jgi:hypothetical protein
MRRIFTMSRLGFWMPVAALGLALVGGVSVAHAQQAGAVDPSTYNLEGPGASNSTRPTLVLPQHVPAEVAQNPGDPGVSGWSPVGGPYTASNGRALATNQLPGDTAQTNVAGR